MTKHASIFGGLFLLGLGFFATVPVGHAAVVVPDEFDTNNPAAAFHDFVRGCWELSRPDLFRSDIFADIPQGRIFREKTLFYRPGHYASKIAGMKIYVCGKRVLTVPALPAGVGFEISFRTRRGEEQWKFSFPPNPVQAQPPRRFFIKDSPNAPFFEKNAFLCKNRSPIPLSPEDFFIYFGISEPKSDGEILLSNGNSELFAEIEFRALEPDDAETLNALRENPYAVERLFPRERLAALDNALAELKDALPPQRPWAFGGSIACGSHYFRDFFDAFFNLGYRAFGCIPNDICQTAFDRADFFRKNFPQTPAMIFAFENAHRKILRETPDAFFPSLQPCAAVRDPEAQAVLAALRAFYEAHFPTPRAKALFEDDEKRRESARRRAETARRDFGIFSELKMPLNSEIYLDGFGQDFIEIPNDESAAATKIVFGFDPKNSWEKKRVSGFRIQTTRDEIRLDAGTPESLMLARAVLKAIRNAGRVPADTLFVCMLFPPTKNSASPAGKMIPRGKNQTVLEWRVPAAEGEK